MNELTEALSLVYDLIDAGGQNFAAWRLYRLERLLNTVRARYFFADDDLAVPAEDEEELVEICETPTFPAA